MMNMLEKIMGSSARVKLMRLFLFHPSEVFDGKMLADRARVRVATVRKEMRGLEKAGFVKKKKFKKESTAKNSSRLIKTSGWILNSDFPLISQMRALLIDGRLIDHDDLAKRLRAGGSLKLILIAGALMHDDERDIDMLLIGNRINKAHLSKEIKNIEAEIGRELRYALFSVEEFEYRVSMYDKLVRDVFDYPHRVLVNNLEMEI